MKARSSWVVATALVATLVAGRSQAETDAKALYVARCAMCHGNDGIAGKLGAGSRNFNEHDFKSGVTEAHIVTIIHDGKGKMKGLGDTLTRQQSEAVAAYVLALSK